ncbi:MAG TPA: glycosyltransferase family 2 protein [Longimicrobiales bacterium]|nr:glycosyltransferase family 2 protein [Longimicrobiales bacterium]
MTSTLPFLSVIVPAHRAEFLLPDTLGALANSDLPRDRWELVVIDDASPDRTALVASRFADTVVRLSGAPHGPSYARNRGCEASRGEVLVFVDADVRVHPDALRRFAELFAADPDLGAAFGSYDDRPPAPGIVSRYRNLLHHYHHHQGAGEAGTFWAGLGAIRTDVFAEVDKYDEWHYERPQIEDIELGRRIRRAGYRILLEPSIQGAHLKRWTLQDVLRTDLFHRGIPWMRLILREGAGDDLLNVKVKEKSCVALLGLAIILLLGGIVTGSVLALSAVPGLLAVIVALNLPLYRYLARGRGWAFGLAVVPLHLMYYLVSGLAAVFGHLHHLAGTKPRPSDRTLERTERGEVCWPPVPVPPRTSIWRDESL